MSQGLRPVWLLEDQFPYLKRKTRSKSPPACGSLKQNSVPARVSQIWICHGYMSSFSGHVPIFSRSFPICSYIFPTFFPHFPTFFSTFSHMFQDVPHFSHMFPTFFLDFLPMVLKTLQGHLQGQALVHPAQVVALGASVQAAMISGEAGGTWGLAWLGHGNDTRRMVNYLCWLVVWLP